MKLAMRKWNNKWNNTHFTYQTASTFLCMFTFTSAGRVRCNRYELDVNTPLISSSCLCHVNYQSRSSAAVIDLCCNI